VITNNRLQVGLGTVYCGLCLQHRFTPPPLFLRSNHCFFSSSKASGLLKFNGILNRTILFSNVFFNVNKFQMNFDFKHTIQIVVQVINLSLHLIWSLNSTHIVLIKISRSSLFCILILHSYSASPNQQMIISPFSDYILLDSNLNHHF